MTLTAMEPQRATELMHKGYEFGRSRLIAASTGPALMSEAGRVLAAVPLLMQASAEYQQQFREAKREMIGCYCGSKRKSGNPSPRHSPCASAGNHVIPWRPEEH
ncbi:hypothetical protein J4732_13490 [Serratia marcescens]|uniref:Uncharacterized protein n=1 Tax=Serratia marcescens TaxID=615 RepID=A0A939NM86_SERMA|nr:hypothetical protein [Serratia marcescens]